MEETWLGVEADPRSWRTWRPVLSIVIVLIIMIAAAIDFAQPAWLLVGLVGPAALAGDEMTRRHRRRAVGGVKVGTGGAVPSKPSTTS